jgi:hypothetical protein
MYRLDCEWEVGQEDLIFASIGAATKWLRTNLTLIEMAKEGDKDIVSYLLRLRHENLITLQQLTIIE